MRGVGTCCVVGIGVLWLPLTAHAADWYVDASAGAGGDGSMGAPFTVLQDGVDAAMPGDTVHVLPGTYAAVQSVRAGADNDRITIVATEARQAIVEADGTAFEIKHSHHTVEGLVFDCGFGGGDCIEGGGSDELELIDIEVRNSGADCIDLRTSSGVLIEASDIHHCVPPYDPNNNADAHGITGDSLFDVTIRDCSIFVLTGDAIQVSPPREPWDNLLVENTTMWTGPLDESVNGWDAGSVIGENAFDSKVGTDGNGAGQNPKATFRNVVAYGWRGPIGNPAAFNAKEDVDFVADGVEVWDSGIAFRLRAPANVQIKNAVIYDVDVAFRFEDGLPQPRVSNATLGHDVGEAFTEAGGDANGPDLRNLLFAGPEVPPYAAGEASNMAADDSAFADAGNHDYHLLMDAPPVDAGVEIADVTHDIEGVPRPFGAAFDIGAHEWTDMPPGGTDGTDSGSDSGSSSDSGSDSETGPNADDGGGTDSGGSAGSSDTPGTASSDSADGDTEGSSSGTGMGDGDEGGCSCRAASAAWPNGWLLLLLAGLLRRRSS